MLDKMTAWRAMHTHGRVIIVEGQPIHRHWQAYRIVDAKTGELERG